MSALNLLATWELPAWGLPLPLGLAGVALLGYLVGRWNRPLTREGDAQARREMKRAHAVAKDLERITQSVKRNLAQHHSSIARFKDRVSALSEQHDEAAWRDLCREAEEILGPTLQLASQIALAYDEIRRQSSHLMSFTEVRTDALTGICNRRALDETLSVQFALKQRYGGQFSVALIDIDHFKQVNDTHGHLAGDQTLARLARLLDESARDTDVVARYGGEEFVVVMPHTDLDGACLFSERLRQGVQREMEVTVSIGVAMIGDDDAPATLLGRADAALYAAKSAGRNQVFQHDGQSHGPITLAANACETPP